MMKRHEHGIYSIIYISIFLVQLYKVTQQNCYLILDENKNLTPRANLIISHTPMGKFGDPEDLIGACIWLASDASKFVTGIIVPIDGGFNAYSGV